MSYTNPNYKLERAFKAIIAENQSAVWVHYTGHDERTLTDQTAYTISKAMGGREYPMDTGNRFIKIAISVFGTTFKSETNNNDDPESNHAENVKSVFDVIKSDGIASLLTSACDDFHAYHVKEIDSDHSVESDKFKDTITLEVYCATVDVT